MEKMTLKEIEAQFEQDKDALARWLVSPQLQFDDHEPFVYWVDIDGTRMRKFAPEPAPPAKNELVWCWLEEGNHLIPEISTGKFDSGQTLVTSNSISINSYPLAKREYWYCPRTGHHSPDFPMHALEVLPK